MSRLVGFGTFAGLLEEQISEKISRRILSGDQGMVVWWSIRAGVHVEPHSHPNEQIVWMLKDGVPARQRTADLRPGRRGGYSGGYGARSMVPRRYRGDRFLCASSRRLPPRWQTRVHERRLNNSLRLLHRQGACSICFTGAPRRKRGQSLESSTDAGSAVITQIASGLLEPDDHSVTSN